MPNTHYAIEQVVTPSGPQFAVFMWPRHDITNERAIAYFRTETDARIFLLSRAGK